MDKNQIQSELNKQYELFIKTLQELSDEQFEQVNANKWSAAQQLEHMIKSVKPVDMAFGLPMFVLKMKFGVANRASKSYEDLVAKYLGVLKENPGYEMPKEYDPKGIPLARREKSFQKLNKLINKLGNRLSRFTEKELDTYILPHPLLGKLTLREMLYFTIYHAEHHNKQIQKNLKGIT